MHTFLGTLNAIPHLTATNGVHPCRRLHANKLTLAYWTMTLICIISLQLGCQGASTRVLRTVLGCKGFGRPILEGTFPLSETSRQQAVHVQISCKSETLKYIIIA